MSKFVCYQRSYQQGLCDLRDFLRKHAEGLSLSGILPAEANTRLCDLISAMAAAPVTAMTWGKSMEVHLHADGSIRILPPCREAQRMKRVQEIVLRP